MGGVGLGRRGVGPVARGMLLDDELGEQVWNDRGLAGQQSVDGNCGSTAGAEKVKAGIDSGHEWWVYSK